MLSTVNAPIATFDKVFNTETRGSVFFFATRVTNYPNDSGALLLLFPTLNMSWAHLLITLTVRGGGAAWSTIDRADAWW